MADRKDRIILHWKKVAFKGWFLVPGEYTGRLDGPELEVELAVSEEEKDTQPARTFRVFQQKAGTYGAYSDYMTRHGCACCSLTTLLAAYVPRYRALRPD